MVVGVILANLSAACSPIPPPVTASPVATPQEEPGSPALRVYFSGSQPRADTFLADLTTDIRAAHESIAVAMYNFSLDAAGYALIEAMQRGVKVRVLLDSDAGDNRWAGRFTQAGVTLVTDGQESLMHNKFLVIDDHLVWTGSMNLTASGLYEDANNMLRIESEPVAARYQAVFDLMMEERLFSRERQASGQQAALEVNGAPVEVLFSPEDGVAGRLVRLLDGAEHSVEVLAYSFTNDRVADALLRAEERGVSVRMLFEEEQTEESGADYGYLRQSGIAARLDGSRDLQHNKVIIVDGEWVVTGSYNFTRSADRTNDENVVILRDRNLSGEYLAEFERLYELGK